MTLGRWHSSDSEALEQGPARPGSRRLSHGAGPKPWAAGLRCLRFADLGEAATTPLAPFNEKDMGKHDEVCNSLSAGNVRAELSVFSHVVLRNVPIGLSLARPPSCCGM